jgi:hypothetical protein
MSYTNTRVFYCEINKLYVVFNTFESSAHGDFHFYLKVAMWTLELGLR